MHNDVYHYAFLIRYKLTKLSMKILVYVQAHTFSLFLTYFLFLLLSAYRLIVKSPTDAIIDQENKSRLDNGTGGRLHNEMFDDSLEFLNGFV